MDISLKNLKKKTKLNFYIYLGYNLIQNVRLRSANRGNANNTWNVNSSGNVNNNNASNSNRFAPDCVGNRI